MCSTRNGEESSIFYFRSHTLSSASSLVDGQLNTSRLGLVNIMWANGHRKEDIERGAYSFTHKYKAFVYIRIRILIAKG